MLLGNLIQNQFAVARNKPFGSALAFELTAAVLVLLLAYAALREAPGRGGAAVRSAMAPAIARGPHGAGLPLPLRADRHPGGLLLQRGAADGVLGGLHPRLVPPAPRTTTCSSGRCATAWSWRAITTVVAVRPRHARRARPGGRLPSSAGQAGHPGPALPAGHHPRGRAGRGAGDLLRRRRAAAVALDGGHRPRRVQRLLRRDRGAGAPRGVRSARSRRRRATSARGRSRPSAG